jgi:hypothetical protein
MPDREKDVTRAECLMAAVTMLANSPLAGRWGQDQWARTFSGDIRQLADRLYDEY